MYDEQLGLKDYLVVWKIDIVAKTPEEAAEKALEIQREPNGWATVFEVVDKEDPDAKKVHVDLG